MSNVYAVSVVYEHKDDGRNVIATAIVGAPDEQTAIAGAIDAVSALPHCAGIVGGMCEELDDTANAQAPNARGVTHPTHPTVN